MYLFINTVPPAPPFVLGPHARGRFALALPYRNRHKSLHQISYSSHHSLPSNSAARSPVGFMNINHVALIAALRFAEIKPRTVDR